MSTVDESAFIEEGEKDMTAVIAEFKQRLSTFTKLLKKFNRGEKEDWTTTSEFSKIVHYIGDYPPIELIDQVLKHYKAKKHDILTRSIPTLMEEAGLKKLVASDGSDIKIVSEVSIKTLDKERVADWLKEHGYEDVLKNTLVFPKGELDAKLREMLDSGYTYQESNGVAPATLKKIIKDRINAEDIQDVPTDDIVEIKQFNIAKVK